MSKNNGLKSWLSIRRSKGWKYWRWFIWSAIFWCILVLIFQEVL
jgi:hypothetical protein